MISVIMTRKKYDKQMFVKIAIVIALLFLIIYSSFPKTVTETRPVTTGTNKNIHFILTDELRNTGELSLELQHYDELSENIRDAIVPRDAFLHEGKITLHGFLGVPFFYAILMSLFGLHYTYIVAILSVLTGLAFFLVSKEMFNEKIAVLSMLLYFTFPFIFFESATNAIDLTTPFLLFFFMGLYYFVKILKNNKRIDYVISGIFFLISLLMRYDNIILIAPLALLLFYEKCDKINIKGLLIVVVIALILFIPLLSLNNYLYGDYFSIGYSTTPVKFVSSSGSTFFSENSIIHLSNYFVELYPIYTILLIFGISIFLVSKTNKFSLQNQKIKLLLFYAISVLLIKIFMHSGGVLWGFTTIALNSSLIRYLSPLLILLFSFISYLIIKFSNKFIIFLMVFLIVYSSFNLTIYGDNGKVHSIEDDVRSASGKISLLKHMEENTEENSIIIVSYEDKLFFPDRGVLFYQRLGNETHGTLFKHRYTKKKKYLPNPETFADIVIEISESGIPLYIYRPSEKVAKSLEFEDALHERDYDMLSIGMSFHKFVRSDYIPEIDYDSLSDWEKVSYRKNYFNSQWVEVKE